MAVLNAPPAYARVGVGVDTGKITLNESIKTNTTYPLPSMMVYNTGDQAAEYEMEVTFNERQPQRKPQAGWVTFSPNRFTLAPHQSQQVTMSITVPQNAQAGDYYAYLEAHTAHAEQPTSTTVSVAAAAKFYFSTQASEADDLNQNDISDWLSTQFTFWQTVWSPTSKNYV